MSLFWRELADVEVDRVVADLEEWVNWLRLTNRRVGEVVQSCWPNHPAVVLQLAAWQEWWLGNLRTSPERRRKRRQDGGRHPQRSAGAHVVGVT